MRYNIKIPPDVNNIIQVLKLNGHSAYIVGGCVRDSILNKNPHDWDICTSATPIEILDIFKNEKIFKTGLQHGTVTIVKNNTPYEVTTFRIDGEYTDNRRPDKVEFTNDIEIDLSRRDFTINAMAYDNDTGLIDLFNGTEDIKQKMICCVGSAKDRFMEDSLRILRAIRFACQLEFIVSPDTDWEIHQQYKNLKNVSVERITNELCKMIACDYFCVQLMLYQDVFSFVIPELKDCIGFKQNNPYHEYDVFNHIVHALENCKSDDIIMKLAVLFHDIGKPHCYQEGIDGYRHFKGHGKVSADMTDAIMRRLKFDNNTRNKVIELISYHDSTFEVGEKYIKRWLNKIGEIQFRRLLELRKADIKGQKIKYEKERIQKITNIEKLLEEVLSKQSCFTLKDLAINGDDLIKTGMLKEGKDIGNWLNNLLTLVINDKLNNTKEDLMYYMTGVIDGWIKY